MNKHDYLSKALAVLLIFVALGAPGCRNAGSARHFTLVEVTGFGSNPGGLQMFKYVPSSSRSKEPMVVVMHGCLQNAQDFADHSGWPEVANQMKFLLVFPQQGVGNNLAKCFHWYSSGDSERDLFRLRILENVGRGSNGHFFRLLKQTLVFVLIGFIHLQVRKHRLHVTSDPAVLDTQLRINRELPPCHVKS